MLEQIELLVNSLGPDVIYLLLVVGIWGVIAALYVPGTGAPEGVGAVGLIAAGIGLLLLPTNPAGLLLFLAAAAAFIAMLFFRHDRWLAASGAALHLAGSMLLFRAGSRVSPALSLLTTSAALLFFYLVLLPGLRIQDQRGALGEAALIGEEARVVSMVNPQGTVTIYGEVWQALSPDPIEPGTRVRVVGQEGLRLHVTPIERLPT